jgi:cytochrome P450
MFLLLAEDPGLQSTLRADPALIPSALEEMMRFATPTRSHTRTVTGEVTIGGQRFRAGDRVHLNWVGANHDPAAFECPERIQIGRHPNRHMSYGFGSHICVGMHMARVEMKVAVEEVLAAMDDIRITDSADVVEEVGTTWAITTLPVTFVPRCRVAADRSA